MYKYLLFVIIAVILYSCEGRIVIDDFPVFIDGEESRLTIVSNLSGKTVVERHRKTWSGKYIYIDEWSIQFFSNWMRKNHVVTDKMHHDLKKEMVEDMSKDMDDDFERMGKELDKEIERLKKAKRDKVGYSDEEWD